MTDTAIFVCHDPHGSHWQLGPLPATGSTMTLIGWKQVSESVDGGIPDDVAAMIARSLTGVARITFLASTPEMAISSNAWSFMGECFVRRVEKAGLAGRIQCVFDRIPYNAVLVSTRCPKTALRLFDDCSFPWWLQGQVAILSRPEAAPPNLDRAMLVSLLGDEWTRWAAEYSGEEIFGVLRPGVDGDVIGLLSLTSSFETAILRVLENESMQMNFEWALLSEDAFRNRLATSL